MSLFSDLRGAIGGLKALSQMRGSLENPEIPLSSPEVVSYFEGEPTSTGVAVNEKSAMGVASVLACVRVLSESVGSLSLETYRRTGNGGKMRATDHPAYRILKVRPNPFMSGINYRELAMKQLVMRGNHYAEIEFDRDGYPVALWPLAPEQTTVVYTERQSIVYVTTIGNQRIGLPSYRVLHISALGDGIKGRGLLDYSKETVGYAAALDRYEGTFFSNGAHPSGFLSHPSKLTPEAKTRLKTAWQMAYGGLSNAHRTAVLEEGIKWEKTSVSPEEAQAIEARKFTRSEIAGILRVPAHFINDLEHATFSNIEHLNISFLVHSLRPWLVRFEQEMNYKLFAGEPEVFVEFNFDSLLRGDKKSRAEALEIERRNGIITPNEWRQMENKNPIESEYGDSFVVQMNNAMITKAGDVVPLSAPSAGSQERGDQKAAREIALAYLRSTVSRIARKEARSLSAWMKKSEMQVVGDAEAVRAFYEKEGDSMADGLLPLVPVLQRAGLCFEAEGYTERSIRLFDSGGLEDWEARRLEAEITSLGDEG